MPYRQQERMQRMLRLLYDALQEALESGEVQLMVAFYAHDGGRLEVYDTNLDIGEALGVSASEAAALLRQLGRDGYIHLDYGSQGPRADFGLVSLDYFTEKGKVGIEELPDPRERLIESLDAIAAALASSKALTPDQKRSGTRTAQELKHFLRGLPPGAAVEVGSTFMRGMFEG